MKKDIENKIPLHTALWSEVYRELKKSGVVFPKNWKGVGACYGGLCAINKILKEYNPK